MTEQTEYYLITDIEWDCDDSAARAKLPALCVTEILIDGMSEDDAKYAAVNRASDEHGWCIEDCTVTKIADALHIQPNGQVAS